MESVINSQSKEKNNILQVIIASSVGTLIEWYDMFLAIILASVLSTQLFPNDGSSHFLETLAVVVSSFMFRPIGSLIFGSIGDKVGRKYSFLVSLIMMGSATFFIGCIPSFETAGWVINSCSAAKEIEPVSMTFTKASNAARFIIKFRL